MPKTIQCHPDWQKDLIKDTVTLSVDAFLGSFHKRKQFKFIGGPRIIGEEGPNVFTITSGTEFVGRFQIIEHSRGDLLEIEFENSSEKAIELLWVKLIDILEGTLTISLDRVQSGDF